MCKQGETGLPPFILHIFYSNVIISSLFCLCIKQGEQNCRPMFPGWWILVPRFSCSFVPGKIKRETEGGEEPGRERSRACTSCSLLPITSLQFCSLRIAIDHPHDIRRTCVCVCVVKLDCQDCFLVHIWIYHIMVCISLVPGDMDKEATIKSLLVQHTIQFNLTTPTHTHVGRHRDPQAARLQTANW